MPGSSNFKVFNEDLQNTETDIEYATETQRISGLVTGIAKTKMHNKLFRQTSVMTAALAQFMADAGQTVSDNDLAALVSVIQETIETPTGAQSKADAVQDNLAEHLADYVRQPAFALTAGTSTAYTATLSPAPTAYLDGFGVEIYVHTSNTGTCTLNVNALGVIPLKKADGTDFSAGELKAGQIYSFRKYGLNFIQVVKGGGGLDIKSRQQGIETVGANVLASTITRAINPVVVANSIIRVSPYFNSYGTNPTNDKWVYGGKILDETTIQFDRMAEYFNFETGIFWEVIEFTALKSKQTGEVVTIADADIAVTVNSVDVDKSLLFWSMLATITTSSSSTSASKPAYLQDATTIKVLKSLEPAKILWQLIELP